MNCVTLHLVGLYIRILARISSEALESGPEVSALKFVYFTNEIFEELYLMKLSAAMIMQNW
jgi:hypothetical protein